MLVDKKLADLFLAVVGCEWKTANTGKFRIYPGHFGYDIGFKLQLDVTHLGNRIPRNCSVETKLNFRTTQFDLQLTIVLVPNNKQLIIILNNALVIFPYLSLHKARQSFSPTATV